MKTGLIGLGLDYNDSGRDSLSRFYEYFRPRLSHLSIVGLPSLDDARIFRRFAGSLPIIHHLNNVAPADPDGPNWENLELQDEISRELAAAWCNEDIGVWNIGPYYIPYFTPPLFERDVAELIAERILRMQGRLSVPFLAEIPSCSIVAGRLSLGEFFRHIVGRSGCDLVLDLAHVYSYALYRGQSPDAVFASMPLDAVRHVHVAGGLVHPRERWCYLDSHDHPIVPEVMALLRRSVHECSRLEAITYEVGPNITDATISAEIDRLDALLGAESYAPRLKPAAARASTPLSTSA
jgi:uncharacterized protein (UPF0276 family)